MDTKQIIADMDNLENAFLLKSEKLNEKRSAQLKKRMAKLLPELESMYAEGKTEEVERLLETLQIPSSKEWGKLIYSLVDSSARAGVVRAHLELLRLKELYEFAEGGDVVERISVGEQTFEVNFPPEAEAYLKKHGYEVGVITEETVRQRIKDVTLEGLQNGATGKQIRQSIDEVTDTWVSQSHADTIARTETAKAYNAGRVARWLDPEQNGFVEALQYDSIVDTRTTDLCRDLDGKIVSVENSRAIAELTPPNHYRCRATWIPVTRYEEWEDNFPQATSQAGFKFESPLPHLIAKRVIDVAKPLVTSTVSTAVAAKTITDPLVIRTLSDDDFREAIGNITDLDMKYFLVKERAQQIAAQNGLVQLKTGVVQIRTGVFSDDTARFRWGEGFESIDFPVTKTNQYDVYDLAEELKGMTDRKAAEKLVEKFVKDHASDPQFMLVNLKLKEFIGQSDKLMLVDKTAFTVQKQTADSLKALTIKRPRQTANYKRATNLQRATDEGEAWLQKYTHPRIAPTKTGVTLRFSINNNRAYAIPSLGEIHFGTRGQSGVIVHEVGHLQHGQHKEVQDLINKFFMRRTNNLKMPASKRMGEKVIADNFYSSYVGRIYGWEERGGQMAYGEEVFSMGLQAMHEDPTEFYRQDPEHFYFTLSIMEGLF